MEVPMSPSGSCASLGLWRWDANGLMAPGVDLGASRMEIIWDVTCCHCLFDFLSVCVDGLCHIT